MTRFKHLKSGDEVLVVPQTDAYRRSPKPEPYTLPIVKVGRKYGCIQLHGMDCPFDLSTGESVHKQDDNSRLNGRGFDVWESWELYRRAMEESANFERLKGRLMDPFSYHSKLKTIPPHVVREIHAVLDKWEAESA